MRWFRTDIDSVAIGQTGHVHTRKADAPQLVVDCAACDPFLADAGGAPTPGEVGLTYDEVQQAERQKEAAALVMRGIGERLATDIPMPQRAAPARRKVRA